MVKARTSNRRNGKPSRLNYGVPVASGRGGVGGFPKSTAVAEHATTHRIVNPWDPTARGSKLPDTDSTRSVAVTIKQTYTLASLAGGTAAATISPNVRYSFKYATAIAGTVVTTFQDPPATADWTAPNANMSALRIVSWGVRIIPLMAPTNQSGYVKIITLPVEVGSGTDAGGSLFEEVHNYPVADCDIHWISKPIGNAFRNYVTPDASPSWETMLLFAEGLPASTNSFRIEITYHLECQTKLTALSGAIATMPAAHNPRVMAAVEHTRSRLSNAVNGATTFARNLWGLTREALGYAASQFGPPIFRQVVPRLIGGYNPRMLLTGGEPIEVD